MDFFYSQLVFWVLMAWMSSWVIVKSYTLYQLEKKIPAACKLANLEVLISEKEGQIKNLSSQFDVTHKLQIEAEKTIIKGTALNKWMDENESYINGVKNELEDLKSKRSKIKDEISVLESNIIKASNEAVDKKAIIKEINEVMVSLRKSIEDGKSESSELDRLILLKKSEVRSHEKVNEQAKNETIYINECIRNLRLEESEFTRQIEELKSKRSIAFEQLAVIEGNIRHGSSRIEIQMVTISDNSETINKSLSKIDDLQKSYTLESQRLISISQDIILRNSDLQVCERSIEIVKQENSKLESSKYEHAEMLEKLEKSISTSKNEISVLNQIIHDLDSSIPKKRELNSELQKEIIVNNDKLEVLRTNQAEARIENQTLKVERDALIKQMESLQGHIEALRQLAETTTTQLGRGPAEDRYRDLWEPLPLKQLKSTASREEKDALGNAEKYLKDLGLSFPKRTLLAFHTALKTADLSPVTVLAGISGTGKSELPKRYAEALGIHFVGLPVQPRWDSPNDLFGFFNHLEGRFKATELARAMVQFERFNRKDWPMPADWKAGKEDQMLMVLLDEMNLARVEYYFSDFLSRLETRRGIRTNDPADRAKAELSLDMGSLGKGEKPIRFYPDRNILFTGTMNEDESTQTLSDKVLDRACVLRFGRPKKLSAAKVSEATSSTVALSFTHWNRWLEEGKPLADLEGRISDLNEAMELMGRPFGHRVSQAIHAYAAQYPSWEGNRSNLALADQIEQRILPKLRGMDTAQEEKPLKAIEKVITSTGDEVLLNAFKVGRTAPAFLWRGVDRG